MIQDWDCRGGGLPPAPQIAVKVQRSTRQYKEIMKTIFNIKVWSESLSILRKNYFCRSSQGMSLLTKHFGTFHTALYIESTRNCNFQSSYIYFELPFTSVNGIYLTLQMFIDISLTKIYRFLYAIIGCCNSLNFVLCSGFLIYL